MESSLVISSKFIKKQLISLLFVQVFQVSVVIQSI